MGNLKVTCVTSSRCFCFPYRVSLCRLLLATTTQRHRILEAGVTKGICSPARVQFLARTSTADQYWLFYVALAAIDSPCSLLVLSTPRGPHASSLHLEGTAINCRIPGGILDPAHYPKFQSISDGIIFPHCLRAFTADT